MNFKNMSALLVDVVEMHFYRIVFQTKMFKRVFCNLSFGYTSTEHRDVAICIRARITFITSRKNSSKPPMQQTVDVSVLILSRSLGP